MQNDPNFYLIMAGISLAGILVLATTVLRGWHEWIAFKHAELKLTEPYAENAPTIISRIDVADLKERVKKLEAIAAGIDI